MSRASEQASTSEHRSGIQVIARAAKIMRVLGNHPEGLSLGELANTVRLPRSTVQRIIGALETEGFAEHGVSGTGYRLGPELGRLLYYTRIDVLSVARPFLEELSSSLQETVVFCVGERDSVLVIDRIVAERELRVVPQMGTIRVPFHSTAPGKALLANMEEKAVVRLLDLAEQQGTLSPSARQPLLEELEQVRVTGIAEDLETYREDVAAYATELDTYLGHFAITVVVPTSRAQKHRQNYLRALMDAKAAVESKLGITG
ncbi:IclR family transcriptional regulator [Marinobacter nauticus]|uniref:IclR family transcriptional regulator n=1 Tax=Marinobacter nauticus TaxID=2743 RepID=A0A1M2URT8_MARNT|nr:IclR family transcriptional regulator [Marinobacter nauticus]OJS98010.1 hypothetical protein BEE62_16975 [Marinobacter nauticus]